MNTIAPIFATDFTFELMFEMPDIVLIWTGRIAILLLAILSYIYFYKKKNKISLTILFGMNLIFIGEFVNYFANVFLFSAAYIATLEKLSFVTRLVTLMGYFLSVAGCYLNVLKTIKHPNI